MAPFNRVDLASCYRVDLALEVRNFYLGYDYIQYHGVELAASAVEQLASRVELPASSDIHEYMDYSFLRYEINLSEYNQIKKLTRKHTWKRATRAKVP